MRQLAYAILPAFHESVNKKYIWRSNQKDKTSGTRVSSPLFRAQLTSIASSIM